MGRNQSGDLAPPISPTKQQFKLVCKVFEVRNGRREAVKKTIDQFYRKIKNDAVVQSQ